MSALLPTPYPEELLYSALARYRDRMRFPSEKTVLEHAFGSRTLTAPVELTGRIDALAAALSPLHSVSVELLLRGHTTLPYYAAFLGAGRLADVTQRLRTGTAHGAAEMIGLRASSVVSPTHLQFCPECREVDLASHGEPYWRRSHQLPGVVVCPEHGVPLWRSAVRRRDPALRHGFRSLASAPPGDAAPLTYPESAAAFVSQISTDTAWLLTQAPASLGALELHARYHRLLGEKGWARSPKQVRMADLRAAFRSHYGPRLLAHVGCRLSSLTGDHDWLARLVRKSHGAQHPLHHVLLIRFLGLSAQAFFSLPAMRETRAPAPAPREPTPPRGSPSASSTTAGHRGLWLQTMAEHPGEGMAALRRRLPATYAHLYRADRSWLESHRPARPAWKPRAPRVDWAARDRTLADRARETTAKLLAGGGRPTRLTATRVIRLLGETSMLARHLHRLPLTRQALEGATETRVAFARRKLEWAAEQYRAQGLRPAPWQLARTAALRPDLVGALSDEIARLCNAAGRTGFPGVPRSGLATGTHGYRVVDVRTAALTAGGSRDGR